MKKQKCPKCGQKANPKGENSTIYQCLSAEIGMVGFVQSPHCRERVKVAKLKKQVERLKNQIKKLTENERDAGTAGFFLGLHAVKRGGK